jgi:hypothetical protein
VFSRDSPGLFLLSAPRAPLSMYLLFVSHKRNAVSLPQSFDAGCRENIRNHGTVSKALQKINGTVSTPLYYHFLETFAMLFFVNQCALIHFSVFYKNSFLQLCISHNPKAASWMPSRTAMPAAFSFTI